MDTWAHQAFVPVERSVSMARARALQVRDRDLHRDHRCDVLTTQWFTGINRVASGDVPLFLPCNGPMAADDRAAIAVTQWAHRADSTALALGGAHVVGLVRHRLEAVYTGFLCLVAR